MSKKRGVRRRLTWKGIIFILAVIVFFVWLFVFSGYFDDGCGQDEKCFRDALHKCSKTEYLNLKDNNLYIYKIKGSSKENCELEIELQKMGVGTSVQLIEQFEGKKMECFVPKEIINDYAIDEIENVINYCSGPLKEAIYQLIIDRLYGLLIKNVKEIIDQVDQELYKIGQTP